MSDYSANKPPRWLVVDLDGTLANCAHRVPLIPDWDAFHLASEADEPYPLVIELVLALEADYNVMILTGRTETHRALTRKWLARNGVPHHNLLMRPDTDWSPDVEMKWNRLLNFFGDEAKIKEQVFCVIEDRDKVVEMWRNRGLFCLQPRLGDY